jgi:lipopolysaccharide/colanic/teichoic acid biosynthesis glycosyltransferase
VNLLVKVTKRIVDLAGSTLALAVTIPFYPAIAAAIILESPGPVFLRQRRAGPLISTDPDKPGRCQFQEFSMLKFRTMRVDAEKGTGPVLATENDPRVTRVGKFLRRTRLDELPQFWNVFLGEMSLVGPRPERPEIISHLAMAIPYFEERMRDVKPGITGLAQISLSYTGRVPLASEMAPHVASFHNPFRVEGAEDSLADDLRVKLLYDLAYGVATESFRSFLPLELSIMLKTPLVMIRGAGT